MCGIVGILSQSNFKPNKAYLTRMADTLAHRGPDGSGTWVNPGKRVGFGHRRLSIIDLSTAAGQPLTSADGQHTIVFNGEIYNHVHIRKILEDLGVTGWQTSHSDTEVILMAYRQWGMPKCLEYLRGMFAFAIWDEARQELFIARDRVGEKPLYYTYTEEGRFLFASEIKAIIADDTIPRTVDEEALFHYLTFLMVPPPRTLFGGISKLPAGHWMKISPKGPPQVFEYWDALDAAAEYARVNTLPATESGWVAHLGKIVEESILMRQEAADVPVGVFLSGGIDSSAVAAVAAAHSGRGKLHTFAIGPDKSYPSWPDETPYAAMMAKQVGSQHHTARLKEADFLHTLPNFIHWQDEPVSDPSAIPIHFLSKAAANAGLKVCQGGEGGDELFVGYEDWLKFARLTRWGKLPIPGVLKKALYKGLVMARRGNRFYAEYLRRNTVGQPLFWGGAEAFTGYEKTHLLSPRMRQRFAHRSSYEVIEPLWKKFNAKPRAYQSFWNWCTWLELHLRLPEQLLMRVDKMAMATALEVRVPLLDPVLIAAVLNTPSPLRAPGGNKKYLLKQILKNKLPAQILNRRKQGLGMPLNEWVLSTYGPYARTVLQDFCTRGGYLHWPAVEALFAAGRGQHLWYLLNLALWWKHFIMQEEIEVISH
ncbi:MAG: asparagine synthase (glutamine-hydrolyzing) [Proteobacteria bacterium]|nr:asparagine synthase (glutamine-hydrolyzing) [Pseudomonadota bacterium]